MAAGDGNYAIYHAFTVGRCRFIVTDNRSERTVYTIADNPTKTVLGAEQKKWFKEQLLAANADPNIAVIFWCNSFCFSGTGSPGAFPPRENWAAYPTERAEIANFIKSNNVQNLFRLEADAHSLAFDDGRTYDFTLDGTNPFPGGTLAHGIPTFVAAPLYQSTSSKGTPYEIGPMIVAGVRSQFGFVTVEDYGSNVLINFAGRDGITGTLINQAGTYMNMTLNGTASPRP
jgi:alkaline phosphatase D